MSVRLCVCVDIRVPPITEIQRNISELELECSNTAFSLLIFQSVDLFEKRTFEAECVCFQINQRFEKFNICVVGVGMQ